MAAFEPKFFADKKKNGEAGGPHMYPHNVTRALRCLGLTAAPPIEYTVLYAPGMDPTARQVARLLGNKSTTLCTADITRRSGLHGDDMMAVCWESFPSDDPNIKLLISAVRGKHIVLLLNLDDPKSQFEQLALLLFLQRFIVPHPLAEYAKDAWKKTYADGKFDTCSAASITVIVPWYRHCQMERTSRWALTGDDEHLKWENRQPRGEYIDVPTANAFAALLSCRPCEMGGAPPAPPKQALFVDIHEYAELERWLVATGSWSNPRQRYDFAAGSGTFFASAFRDFLSREFAPKLDAPGSAFVVFPDHGAHRRFCTMVVTQVGGISRERVLFLSKKRTGTEITQSSMLSFVDEAGEVRSRDEPLPEGATVLIADDFTNSGSTLFGGADIIRKSGGRDLTVSAYVSHFVAMYSRSTVAKFVERLYDESALLDRFHCTDSIPRVVAWLNDEISERVAKGAQQKARVVPIAPVVAQWIRDHPPPTSRRCNPFGPLF